MSDHLSENLTESRKRFIEIFGRKPDDGDYVLFEQFLQSRAELEADFVSAALSAGVERAKVYASQVTDRIISESNLHLLSEADLDEWDDAICEYDLALEQGVDLLEGPDLRSIQAAEDWFELARMVPIHFGSYCTKVGKDQDLGLAEFCQAMVLSRVHELSISFYNQITVKTREEVFLIIRALYECYLILVFVERDDEKAQALLAQGFVGSGAYQYKKRSDGREDRRWIVELKSGREFPAHTSFYKMAESSRIQQDVAFFQKIYDLLSRHVHFSASRVDRYFTSDGGFSTSNETNFEEAAILGFSILKMLTDIVANSSLSPEQVKADAKFLGKRVRRSVNRALKEIRNGGGALAPESSVIQDRISKTFRSS